MKFSRNQNDVNAGSMADIAFLLLIFFLVTTTIPNDEGIPQKLPRECTNPPCQVDLHENDILRVVINFNNDLLVEGDLLELNKLKDVTKAFINNNLSKECNYCTGLQLKDASDSPQKAVISLTTDRDTSYDRFIAVQNELISAYTELRTAYAIKEFGVSLEMLTRDQLIKVKKAYPQIISEAETN